MTLDKALFISQEITPYLPATPLATLCRDLPQFIQEKGIEVRTFMPKYGVINERRNQLHEVIRLSGLNILIDDNDHPLIIKVATLQPSRTQVYFIDNDDYFYRTGSSSELETETSASNNDERIMFFARGVIETVKKLRWIPGVVHCTGWATALAPLYIRRMYGEDPTLKDSKIVFSVYPGNPVENLTPKVIDKLKMDGFSDQDIASLIEADGIDGNALSRIAIDYSDGVVAATADADPALLEYARSKGIPVMDFPGDADYADAYRDFYASLND
ncbi:MAG: glycogen/starch synthase [Muribaculaceae bacterium]